MLRTCSEPDLAKLFRTTLAENPFLDEKRDIAGSLSFGLGEIEDDEDEETESQETDMKSTSEKQVQQNLVYQFINWNWYTEVKT